MSVISGGRSSDRDINLGKIARTVAGWVTTGDATSTTLLGMDRSGGGVSLYSTTDNECAVYEWGGGEMFDFGDVGSRTTLQWKQKFTSATDAGNMFVGFSDLSGNTLIGDSDTIGSGDHIGIACLSAAAASRAFLPVAQNAAANSGTALAALTMVTATEYRMKITVENLQGGMTIRYYIDDMATPVQTVTGFTRTSFGPELALVICVSPKGTAANTLDIYEMTVSHRAMS